MIRLGNKVSGKKNAAETLQSGTKRGNAREDAELTSPERIVVYNFVNYFKYAAARFCNTGNDGTK